jgi:hypothetical protein
VVGAAKVKALAAKLRDISKSPVIRLEIAAVELLGRLAGELAVLMPPYIVSLRFAVPWRT